MRTKFSQKPAFLASLLGNALVDIGIRLLPKVRDTTPGSNPTGNSCMAPGLPHECLPLGRVWYQISRGRGDRSRQPQ